MNLKTKSFLIHRYKTTTKEDKLIDSIKDILISKGFTYDENKGELALIFGGDGSLFHFANKTNYSKKYALINCGHLGYYSDYPIDKFASALEKASDFFLEEIPCYLLNVNKKELLFVNDTYFIENKPIEIELVVNSNTIFKMKANGLVLGTSIGSSGYLNSLNMPIDLSNKNNLLFSLVAPIKNKLNKNSVDKGILSINDIVEVNISSPIDLFHDGIKEDEKVKSFKVSKSNKKMYLIHLGNISNLERVKKAFN